jgi:DNA-binding PadR family transcriptional regulator
LTTISANDILYISIADITACDKERVEFMPESIERGALTEAVFYILLSLLTPMHGYGMMQRIKELSNERVIIGAGTLYGAINTLLEKGWIKPLASEMDSRKKEYVITDLGYEIVKAELIRLEELLNNGKKMCEGVL